MNILKPLKGIVLLFCLVFGIRMLALANTPITDLTSHVASLVLPSGAALEWHNALPISSSNLEPNPSAVLPGIYYAVYNFGNGCYSVPTPIKVVSNNCPNLTINLAESIDSSNKPQNTIVTFHSSLPVSIANKLSNTDVISALPGTYFVSYYTASEACFTPPSVLIFVGTVCEALSTNLSALIKANAVPIGATIEWKDSAGAILANPLNASPGLYTASYNFGNGCFSTPTKVRVVTNVCPSVTADITRYVDSAFKPNNSIVTYHSNLPVSNTNRLTAAKTLAADSGTYYVAYYDLDGKCYTSPSAIVVAYTDCIVLPLEINNIDVSLITNKCNVVLNWKVSNQDNIDYFGIMKKAEDELLFKEVAQIKVNKAKPLPAQYLFDFNNLDSKSYLFYIKTVNINAETKNSQTIATVLNCKTSIINVYPNPVNSVLNIKIDITEPQTFDVKIIDILGRTIISEKLDLTATANELHYNLSNYANGLYNIIIVSEDQRKLYKVNKIN